MKKILLYIIVCCFSIFVAVATSATLKWDASTGDVNGYTVYFTDGSDTFNYDAGTSTEVLNFEDTLNLNFGKTYTFTVRAYNNAGESGDSNSVSFTTPDAYVPPVNNIPVKETIPPIIINFIME